MQPGPLETSVSVEIDADGLCTIKIATDWYEVNIRMSATDALRLEDVVSQPWLHGSLRLGESAGAPVHWSAREDGRISILVGHDDETWDVAVSVDAAVLRAILGELAASGLTRRCS